MRCPTLTEIPVSPGKTGWPWTEESPQLPETIPDGRPWPKLSIVMPSYNQAKFIEATIRSVLLQGYPNLEFVIMDGGSNDGSVGIIRKYAPWIAYWASEPDRGQSHAINKGIARATGQILHWINSDDLILPNAFSTIGQLFVENSKHRLITGQAKVINVQGDQVGEVHSGFSSWVDFATRQCDIAQVATFFDRKLFDELGMIDESLEYCMDSDVLLRFTRKYPPLVIKPYVTAYRTHYTTKFEHNRLMGFKEADRTYLKHLFGGRMEPLYREWSAGHWLRVSSFENMSYADRMLSILQAMKMKPAILRSWEFYLAVIRANRIALREAFGRKTQSRCLA